jgi:hypothetical protein
VLTEFQGVVALQDMLEYLTATRDKHPHLRIIGVLPTRFIRRWQAQEGFSAKSVRWESASECQFSILYRRARPVMMKLLGRPESGHVWGKRPRHPRGMKPDPMHSI